MGSKGNRQLVPQAKKQLNQMKYEIANELNIPSHATQTGYWGDLTCKQCGSVGGEMVKRMIAAAENTLANGATMSSGSSFSGTLSNSNR